MWESFKNTQLIILLSVSVEQISDSLRKHCWLSRLCRCPHHGFCLSDTHSREKREYQCANYKEVNYRILILSYFVPLSKQPRGQYHRLLELFSQDNFQLLRKKRQLTWIFRSYFLFLGGGWIRKDDLKTLNSTCLSLEIFSRRKQTHKQTTPKTKGNASCFLTAPRKIDVCIWKKSISC